MFDLGGRRPKTSDRQDIVARSGNLDQGDLLARLQDLQQRVDTCERAVENETKDRTAELHFFVQEIQDRVAMLDTEMHTQVLQIKKDFSKMIPQACSSSTLSKESSTLSKEPSLVQLETTLELVRQEVAETRQNVDIKLQSVSEKSRLTQLEVRLNYLESGLAHLNMEFNELQAKTAGLGPRLAADQADGESQAAQQAPTGLQGVVQTQHLEDLQQVDAVAHLEQDAATAERDSEGFSGKPADGTHEFEFVVAESMWSLIFVYGQSGATWLDLLISTFLLMTSFSIQVFFSIIVTTPSFLGAAFEEEKIHAENWRRTMAHSLFYVEQGTQYSLGSRVCWGAGSLIVSTGQSQVIQHINHYLGTDPDPAHEFFLAPPRIQPGICLCLLCIALWCLAIMTELRDALSCVEAVHSLPKLQHTLTNDGRVAGISWLRATLVYACSLVRSGFAVYLLIVGIIWLARTISIQDLILNAVALVAVLDVDEMVFTAMMPKRLQTVIQNMEAIPISYSKGYEQLRSVAIFLCMPAVMTLSYYFFLQQLSVDMIAVKTRMCDGNIDFAFAQNKQGMMYAARTNPFVEDREDISLAEQAVQRIVDYSGSDWHDVRSIAYTTIEADIRHLKMRETETLGEFVSQPRFRGVALCQDYDVLPFAEQLDNAGNWALLKELTGINSNTCGDFRELCGNTHESLLRFLCPQTCRCDAPYKGLAARTPKYGCIPGCGSLVATRATLGPCMDMPADQDWLNIMTEMYETATTSWTEEEKQKVSFFYEYGKEMGCGLLDDYEVDPVRGSNLCEGSSEIGSLVGRCPVTCACWNEEKLSKMCPSSCFDEENDYHAPCLDVGLPDAPDGSLVDCAAARAQGDCESHPDWAEKYCRATCGFCCADAGLQTQSMLWVYLDDDDDESCAGVKAAGLCESAPYLAAMYCRATCNFCTNTTPIQE